jgi:dTDP-4-dehydrorhamnose 3,5-epimerase
VELSGQNQKQLFVPRGFAHGYACLSETAIFAYQVDNYYNKAAERSIAYNDPQLAIDWKISLDKQLLSPKDRQHPTFGAAPIFDLNTPLYA